MKTKVNYFCYNEKFVMCKHTLVKSCLDCCQQFDLTKVYFNLRHRLVNSSELKHMNYKNDRCNVCRKKIISVHNVADCDECNDFTLTITEKLQACDPNDVC